MEKPERVIPRVLACRPKEQNAAWIDLLTAKGLETLDIPLLQINPAENPADKQAIKNLVLKLDEFDFLIFISQNAVKYAFEWIADFWPQLPEKQVMLAIGRKTAILLENICNKQFASSAYNLINAEGAMTSEALLQLSELNSISDKKVVIFKGSGGREKLARELVTRGAKLETCELYKRVFPAAAYQQFAEQEFKPERDIFVVFSGETLANLELALNSSSSKNLKAISLLVPGERVASQAHALGFKTIYQAENASEEAMWQTLTTIPIIRNT